MDSFPQNRLVLFLSQQCDACRRTLELKEDVRGVDFEINWVTQSRINGMYQMLTNTADIYPRLINKRDLPAVPALYDPVLDQMFIGLDEIEKYFSLSGLISED